MHLYPVFLELSDALCLVVGAGAVGRRKLRGLLDAGAGTVRVVALSDPSDADEDVRALLGHPAVRFEQRAFRPEDVEGCRLVCATADVPAVNAAVAEACRTRSILCTVADKPEAGSYITPACISRGPLRIGLSTGGLSPALARRIKNDLAAWLADRYDQQIGLLARLRPLLLEAEPDQGRRARIFHRIAGPDMNDALREGNREICVAILRDALPPLLHDRIPELLHELV